MISRKAFLETLIEQYKPFPYEIDRSNPLYGNEEHQNWAVRHSKRFYHAYSTSFDYVKDGSTILDVGAYPGSYLRIMRLLYGSQVSLLAAGMPVQESFPKDLRVHDIDFIPCDLDDALSTKYPTTLDIPDESVDVVFCTEIIEHLYSVKRLMAQVRRVLKPKGVAFFTTNNVAYLPGLIRLLWGETNLDVDIQTTSALVESEWRGHVRFYSLNQLCSLMSYYKLDILDKGYFQMRVPKVVVSKAALMRWRLSRLLDAFVMCLPLYRSHIYVLAQKPSTTT